jgi:cell division septation protein DedD
MYKAVLILGLAACFLVTACSRQQSDWEKTRAANTTDAYELFLKKYPSGEFTAQAQARVKELYEERDWQKARDIDSADAYQVFLKQYPEGKWSEEARIRIENFTLAAAPSNGTSAGPEAAAADAASTAAAPKAAGPAARTSVTPASKPQPSHKIARNSPSGVGKYGVQLGAFKTGEAAAKRAWADLAAKYPQLLGGLSPHVSPRRAATGTMYRLQILDLSGKRASSLCKSLKAHAQACEVLPPRLVAGARNAGNSLIPSD